MKQGDLIKIWQTMDNRISTINERTKSHTIDIKKLEKEVKRLNDWIKLIEGEGK